MDNVSIEVLAAFKEWRLAAEDNERSVTAGTFKVDLAALRKFYVWASNVYPDLPDVLRTRVVAERFWGDAIEQLEAAPSGVRRADVKWMSGGAYRQWRNVGLRGFTADGLPSASWKGRTEDRDVAFADSLYLTGLRCGELSSLLILEVPRVDERDLYRCDLAALCTKSKVGRPYWLPVRGLQAVRSYVEEGSRPGAVARAQRSGRYDLTNDKWILESVSRSGLVFVDEAGGRREIALDQLTPERRLKLFRRTPAGLEPLAVWVNDDGRPRPKQAWSKTFQRGNARVLRTFGPRSTAETDRNAPKWFCRPHILRHSFALRWFSILEYVRYRRVAGLSVAEQREMREELGDIWFHMSTLLGHASPLTSKNVYLEPFQALEIETLVALMDPEEKAALERIADKVALLEPRVQSVEGRSA